MSCSPLPLRIVSMSRFAERQQEQAGRSLQRLATGAKPSTDLCLGLVAGIEAVDCCCQHQRTAEVGIQFQIDGQSDLQSAAWSEDLGDGV